MRRVQRLVPACLASLTLLAAAAHADWLVTRDGARVETKGPWKVDGRRVVFTLPDGTLSMMRADQLDLDASAVATAEALRKASAPPPVPVKREPVLRLTEKDIPPVDLPAEAPAEGGVEGDTAAANSGLEVISWDKTENASGDGLEIFGTIRNSSANVITSPAVLVAIYDEDGGLLGTNSGVVNAPSVQPGKTVNFRVAFPGIPDFAAAKFDAQGVGFKTRSPEDTTGEGEAPAEEPLPEEEPAQQ